MNMNIIPGLSLRFHVAHEIGSWGIKGQNHKMLEVLVLFYYESSRGSCSQQLGELPGPSPQ